MSASSLFQFEHQDAEGVEPSEDKEQKEMEDTTSAVWNNPFQYQTSDMQNGFGEFKRSTDTFQSAHLAATDAGGRQILQESLRSVISHSLGLPLNVALHKVRRQHVGHSVWQIG
jgi:hypothetical protein